MGGRLSVEQRRVLLALLERGATPGCSNDARARPSELLDLSPPQDRLAYYRAEASVSKTLYRLDQLNLLVVWEAENPEPGNRIAWTLSPEGYRVACAARDVAAGSNGPAKRTSRRARLSEEFARCPRCSYELEPGYWHCRKCHRSTMPADVREALALDLRAAGLGVRPDQLRVYEGRSWTWKGMQFKDVRTSVAPDMQLTDRQIRAAKARRGTDAERIVGAALGWRREFRADVRTPTRRARALDVAEPLAKVDVELDASSHSDTQGFDALYDHALQDAGWTVLRYWNDEALGELDRVCREATRAAGGTWPDPVAGDIESALDWAATAELQELMRPVANHFGEVLIPQVLPDGIIAFWLPLMDRFTPAAYLLVPDAGLILTSLMDRLAGRHERGFLMGTLRDLAVYDAWSLYDFQLWPDLAPKLPAVLAALDEHLINPARRFAASDEPGRVKILGEGLSVSHLRLLDARLDGSSIVIDGELPNDDWEIGGVLQRARVAIFHSSLTTAERLTVRIWAPTGDQVFRTRWVPGDELAPFVEEPRGRVLLCDATMDRETSRTAVRDPSLRESTLWKGVVTGKWGVEHLPPPA